jgi:hypothetical protein
LGQSDGNRPVLRLGRDIRDYALGRTSQGEGCYSTLVDGQQADRLVQLSRHGIFRRHNLLRDLVGAIAALFLPL